MKVQTNVVKSNILKVKANLLNQTDLNLKECVILTFLLNLKYEISTTDVTKLLNSKGVCSNVTLKMCLTNLTKKGYLSKVKKGYVTLTEKSLNLKSSGNSNLDNKYYTYECSKDSKLTKKQFLIRGLIEDDKRNNKNTKLRSIKKLVNVSKNTAITNRRKFKNMNNDTKTTSRIGSNDYLTQEVIKVSKSDTNLYSLKENNQVNNEITLPPNVESMFSNSQIKSDNLQPIVQEEAKPETINKEEPKKDEGGLIEGIDYYTDHGHRIRIQLVDKLNHNLQILSNIAQVYQRNAL